LINDRKNTTANCAFSIHLTIIAVIVIYSSISMILEGRKKSQENKIDLPGGI